MSAEVAAVKALATVASDKRGRVTIATILCSILMLFFLPLIVYMGIMSNLGEVKIDTVQSQESIVQNMSAEEKAKLQHVENVMNEISKECSKRKLKSIVSKRHRRFTLVPFMMSRSLIMISFQNLLIVLNRHRTITNCLICLIPLSVRIYQPRISVT